MRRRSFFAAILIGTVLVSLVRADATDRSRSRMKDWPGPDVSLKLENRGKESATGRTLREHESTADSLFGQKHYEEAAREYQKCVDLDPKDFHAHLFLGYSFYDLRRYDDAVNALKKAEELCPGNFDANLWSGISLTRVGRFKEAILPLEKARAARKDDRVARRELFLCYVITGQTQKGLDLYPTLIASFGGALLFVYFLWFATLLPFSLPLRSAMFPGLRFSIAWLALFFEGQFAFLLLLSALPWLHLNETILAGVTLSGLPIIAVAATGFARQPWGAPFRWPLRFGPLRTLLISLLLVLLIQVMSAACLQLYTQLTNNPAPLQNTIPLIQNALSANPAVAWLAVAFFIPLIEEVLFRGLLFGAFEKRWGIKAAILGSSFLFACIHFQWVGFLYLFCFGMVLGWARWQSSSLGLPILIHSLNNAVALSAITVAGSL